MLNEVSQNAVTRLESGTLLDISATNMLNRTFKLSIVHNGKSDHAVIYTSVSGKAPNRSSAIKKTKLNTTEAVRRIENIDNQCINDGSDLNITFQKIVNDCTTTISIRSNQRILRPHVNRELILAIRERDRVFLLTKLYPDNVAISNLHQRLVNFIDLQNYRRRTEYEHNRIQAAAGDTRKQWKIYKEVLFNRTTDKRDKCIMIEGVQMSDSTVACNVINERFCTAGEKLATSIIGINGYDTSDIDNLYPEHAGNNFSFKTVSPDDVTRTIAALPDKQSTSYDRVPISLFKRTVNKVAPIIAFCFNLAIMSSVYPVELLKGRLKLIHKSGSNDIDNFRGLTLLPSLSKVFESLLLEQLYDYFINIKLFVGNQFGFLKKSSCQSAALQLVDLIKSKFRRKFVACVFIDLKSAFDTVDSGRLLKKLKRLGLSDAAVALLASFQNNRQTATSIGEHTSGFKDVKVGVPQGSKLGPIQFIVYINDLLRQSFIGRLLLYADDAVLTYVSDSMDDLQSSMQKDMIILHSWLARNVLTMNAKKTKYMTFGIARHQPDIDLSFDGQKIERVREFKYLGLILDENLSFGKHVDHVKKQIRPFISLMWRNGKFIPVDKRKQLYFSYVQSHLMYMIAIYAECPKKKLKELQTVQNACLKAMYRLPRLTPSTYLYSLSILPIEALATVERVTNIRKMMSSSTKHNFTFANNASLHSYETRTRNNVHSFNPYTTRRNETNMVHPALILAVDEYNQLGNDILQSRCIDSFRRKVKLKVMTESDKYCVISPFYYVN